MNNYPYNLFECMFYTGIVHSMIITEKDTQVRMEVYKTMNGEWFLKTKHGYEFIDESNVEILDFISIMYIYYRGI